MKELAVFGAGRIGSVHAFNAAAQPSMQLKYLVEPNPGPHCTELLGKTGAELVDADTVFGDPNIAGVIIASSTDSHAELLRKAVAAKKAIFCEKPISLDFATVEAVSEEVIASGVPCLLGFQRRYDPNFRAVRDRIMSGKAGRLEHIVMHTRDPAPPPRVYVEVSGGMFRDQAIHDFDMARYLLGEEVTTVYAAGGCLIDPEIGAAGDIDTAMVTLTSASGRLVQMINCRRAPFGYDERLEALCSIEVLYVENTPRDSLKIADANGFLTAAPMNYFIERFAAAYRLEMIAFAEMIDGEGRPLADIHDGVEAQRIAEAAVVSLRIGSPVRIGPDWRP